MIYGQKVVEKVLKNIQTIFEYVIANIEKSKDLSKLFISKLMSSFNMHKQKINRVMSTSSLEQTFQSKVNMKNRKRYEGGEISNKFYGGWSGRQNKENYNGDRENYKSGWEIYNDDKDNGKSQNQNEKRECYICKGLLS